MSEFNVSWPYVIVRGLTETGNLQVIVDCDIKQRYPVVLATAHKANRVSF